MQTADNEKHGAAGVPIGAIQRADGESPGLVCNEIWGGNRIFHGPIELPGIQGVLFTQPCDGARGGDVHYLSVCGSGLLSRICLADVTGHGESVANVSQTMHKQLRASINGWDERKVLRRLNHRLSALGGKSFTTAVALSYFPPTRRLSISYAGHEPAWYYNASLRRWSQLEPVERKGLFDIMLAADPNARYTRRVQRTRAGDRLLMITDGVLEAPNDTDGLFGRERLTDILEAECDRNPQELVLAVVDALYNHTNGAPLHHDDVTVLMIEFVENMDRTALSTMLYNRLFRRKHENQ